MFIDIAETVECTVRPTAESGKLGPSTVARRCQTFLCARYFGEEISHKLFSSFADVRLCFSISEELPLLIWKCCVGDLKEKKIF